MQKMKYLIGFGVLVIIIGLTGCTTQQTEENDLSTFSYKQYGFGIEPPAPAKIFYEAQKIGEEPHWHIVDNPVGYEVSFLCPDTQLVPPADYTSPATLSIRRILFEKDGSYVPRDMFNDQTLSEYGAEYMETYIAMLINVSFISNTTSTINGMNAYVSIFTYVWDEIQEYQEKYVLVEKDGIVFSLTYIAEKNYYDSYITVVDQSINSFTPQ